MTKTSEIKEKSTTFFRENGSNRKIYELFAFRLELMFEQGIKDEKHLDFACIMDYVQYHYVCYLVGRVNTLHRAFKEVDDFKNHEFFDKDLLWMLLGEIKQYLIENEMYESLELYFRSLDKVLKRAGVLHNEER
jgi:hypothetical protein